MRTSLSNARKVFFSPETFLPFLIGSTFLAVLGNAVTQILTNWLGTSSVASVKIAVGALLVFGLSVRLFARGLARLRPLPVELNKRSPEKRRGLILLVSRPDTCRKAIAHHQPTLERSWLICSTRSLSVAEGLRSEFSQVAMPDPIVVNDVNNPSEFCDRVNEIYSSLPAGWSDQDVIADYTGMTAHGSVGMALACLSPQRPLQYTPAEVDEQLRPIRPLDPIEIILDSERVGIPRASTHQTEASA